ncbi:MAG: YitT family protein [Chitinophagaceae bacterium]|nr:YitT family protein [Chitinophagaceae bacterium]
MKNSETRNLLLNRIILWQTIGQTAFIAIGVLSAALGLKGFLLPSGFLDGGVTGISLLINRLSGMQLPLLIFIINIPFILLGYQQVSLFFALKTMVAIAGLSLVLAFISFPEVTTDPLLVAVFGGFFLGAGIGMCIRGGAVIDGTEVLAIYISKKSTLSVGDVIMIFNIIIFSTSALLIDIETAMYAMLTYLAAGRTVDFIITGIEEYTGITIISEHSNSIREVIIQKLGRGVTIYNGKRGFGSHEHNDLHLDIIFTVITRLEVQKLKNEVEKIDRHAFIIQQAISDTRGGMVKKRPLH